MQHAALGEQDQKIATRFLNIFVASGAKRIYVKEKYVKQKYGILDAYINN